MAVTGQLDYFEERAHALEPGAQIVLCSAKPTWTATHHDDPTAPDVLTSTAPRPCLVLTVFRAPDAMLQICSSMNAQGVNSRSQQD
jgi:hypothetical protein